MKDLLLKLIDRWQQQVKKKYLDKNLHKLNVKSFTVVSSNCWGGILYQDFGLNYLTPFVNMYMHAPCYLKLASDFKQYMKYDLSISMFSKYFPAKTTYPVGHLKDVEIHFIHYSLNDNVIEKWNTRRDRINYERLLFVLSERDGCTPDHIKEFDNLELPHKLMLTGKSYKLEDAYPIVPSLGGEVLSADLIAGFSYRKINIVQYLNKHFTDMQPNA